MSNSFWYNDDTSFLPRNSASSGSRPETGVPSGIGSSSSAKTTLPSPKSATPKVADSGKVRFGAGFRLGASK